jgi:hypothetical protein
LTGRDTGRRNEIMSAVRELRSSERDHGAPGRSLMTHSRPPIEPSELVLVSET